MFPVTKSYLHREMDRGSKQAVVKRIRIHDIRHSTKKISNTSKAVNIAVFGVFALGKVTKQWHCNNCKSDF